MSMIGKTLGSFECTALLGKGGMGEVYKAKDQKLGRDVAIKVLPEEFAKDTDRVARFQREAKLLASLNHPNIAAIHGLEESNGTHFLVLELIEGDTLADRLKRGAIPVEESLKLALQIAEALEAAHEKGVIHRDLKPANIKVTPDGKVKVLDFGLAKAFAGDPEGADLSNSPTLSAAATQQGVILGTAAYMSPEQARGKPVDKRTDIWAFGVVLYEMLTGQSAFQGEDVSVTLASVIKGDANLNLFPPSIHPRVREVITRCLQNDIRRRYSSIADARYEIEHALSDPSGLFVQPVSTGAEKTRLQQMAPWVVVIGLTAIIVGVAVWSLKPSEPRRIMRFDYELPESHQFTGLNNSILAVSPEGNGFVYCTSKGIFLRRLDELEARLISGTDENSLYPFFSPDGQWLGYWSPKGQQLKKIPIGGGLSVPLSDSQIVIGASWNEDDTIIYGTTDQGIMRISANGGIPEVLVDSEEILYAPQILPGGRSILFSIYDGGELKIAVQSLESGERNLLETGFFAEYLPTGHIVYGQGNNLLALPFDLETLEVEGEPILMIKGIQWLGSTAAPQYAVSSSGTLVYIPGGMAPTESRTLARVHLDGLVDPLNAPAKAYVSPRVSPDGKKLAVQSLEADSSGTIWLYNLTEDNEILRLTYDGGNYRPIWTPDSQRITFSSDMHGAMSLYWMPANGSGLPERLTTAEDGTSHWPCSWSPDGETLAYRVENDIGSNWEIWMVSPGGEPECIYHNDNITYLEAQFHPDGDWIAYSSCPASGDFDIWVEPFPPTGLPRLITQAKGGGISPLWSPDGNQLFYRPTIASGQPIALKVVDISVNPEFSFRNDRTLPITGFSNVSFYRGFDITPDGAEFIMTFPAELSELENRSIHVVVNWFEELKELVPVN